MADEVSLGGGWYTGEGLTGNRPLGVKPCWTRVLGGGLYPLKGSLAVCFRRQSGDANPAVAFVADVQADEQSGDLFEDAGVF